MFLFSGNECKMPACSSRFCSSKAICFRFLADTFSNNKNIPMVMASAINPPHKGIFGSSLSSSTFCACRDIQNN